MRTGAYLCCVEAIECFVARNGPLVWSRYDSMGSRINKGFFVIFEPVDKDNQLVTSARQGTLALLDRTIVPGEKPVVVRKVLNAGKVF